MKRMGEKYLTWLAGLGFLMLISCQTLRAQNVGDILRYGLQYPEGDPVSMVMPGVSYATGFGAYQQNPASMAFFNGSFLTFGVGDRYVNENGFYITSHSNYSNNQFNVGDVGLAYKVPTKRGKLVIGLGYSQSQDFNRALSGHGYNGKTSLTDFWASKFSSNDLFNAAFDAFAIDDIYDNNGTLNDQGKGQYQCSESIFTIPLISACNDPSAFYPGINQRFNQTERGVLGEYSVFIATELLKNFEVGASIGVISGYYDYKRHFLESDIRNNYRDRLIVTTGNNMVDTTDVNNILTRNSIHDSFTAFSARLGFIYQISPHFNVGASYQFKNVLHIHDKYGTHIKNTMDDGTLFTGKNLGDFDYKITRPARLNVGITAKDFSGFTISVSGQRVAYTSGRIVFNGLSNKRQQNVINAGVDSTLTNVFNIRAGVAYQVNNNFTARIGYGHYPSPTKQNTIQTKDATRNFYSAGFTAHLSRNTTFNAAAQLGIWNDVDELYTTPFGTEIVTSKIKHWNIMAGITYYF
jgi:hypothetical protein